MTITKGTQPIGMVATMDSLVKLLLWRLLTMAEIGLLWRSHNSKRSRPEGIIDDVKHIPHI